MIAKDSYIKRADTAVRPPFVILCWCLFCSNANIKFFNSVRKVIPGMVICLQFSVCTSFRKPETFPWQKLARTSDSGLLFFRKKKNPNQTHTEKINQKKSKQKKPHLQRQPNKHPPKSYAAWQSSIAVL